MGNLFSLLPIIEFLNVTHKLTKAKLTPKVLGFYILLQPSTFITLSEAFVLSHDALLCM